jgi:hypothetical protein
VAFTEGLDYAWGRPDPQLIIASGREFVIRYISHDTTGKDLSAAEAERLSAAGLRIAIVFESSAGRMLSGRTAGVTDARFAIAKAVELGMPPDRPIYFACDFDATPAQQTAINAYLDGVASVIGVRRTGMYAGYGPIKRALDAGKITWAWQTFAWSGGLWDARAQLRQYSNEHLLDGVSVDYDQARVADYGQWRTGAAMTISDADVDKIAVAVLNRDNVIPATDGSTTNTHWALRTHIYNIAVGVLGIQAALGRPTPSNPSDVTAIIAGVLKGLDGGTGKGMINQIIDGVTAGVLAGSPPAAIDTDEIARKVVEGLAHRMES